jgi:hypothetical protein
VALASGVVAAVACLALRLGLNALGHAIVGWSTILEYELAVAALGLATATLAAVYMRAGCSRRWTIWGMVALLGFTVLHLVALKSLGYPPTWLTSATWAGALAGQFGLAMGAARWLAEEHLVRSG